MAKKLFVGSLAYATTVPTLEAAFAAVGPVVPGSAIIITDHMNNNRSKGFGFIEMETDEAATAAINALNGTELDGRKIVVAEAQARPEGDRGPRRAPFRRQ